MKEATLFNPLNIPDLALPGREPQPVKPKVKTSRKKSAARPRSRIVSTRRVMAVSHPATQFVVKVRRKVKTSWHRIKRGITTRLARLDRDKLKRVLLACGISATVALLIIALSKLTPLIVALLALLGLGALFRLWERLQVLRLPH